MDISCKVTRRLKMLKKDIVVEKMTGQSIINKKLRGLIIINKR